MKTAAERAENARRRRRLKAYGQYECLYVDAAPTRDHLRALADAGIGTRRVAQLTGLSTGTIWRIRENVRDHVLRTTAARIAAITVSHDTLAPGCRIDGRGVRRRLQALQTRGWTTSDLARQMISHPATVDRLLTADRVTIATHDRVAATFDRLWDQLPVAHTDAKQREIDDTRRRAAEAGWVPPLAWDDIDTDDAPAAPEPVEVDQLAVDLAIAGERIALTRAERHQALRVLHARGLWDRQLAEHLGVDIRTIDRDRKLLGLPANYWNDIEAAA
ncbi:hypothetical protein [Microbacterium arborescens]